jgi:protein-L-isoaspartate(D-aspartate) O-methyltransferase
MIETAEARLAMVRSQLLPNKVTDDRVTTALADIPRERFVPKELRGVAYLDEDIRVAPGRYLMEPMVFARLLQVAEIKDTDVVLDVGCATGYSAAVLGSLAGTVVALESDESLAAKAVEQLSELEIGNAAVLSGPLTEGLKDQGPYDVIFLEGAVDHVPPALTDQLAEGGRLIAVIDKGVGEATVITRHEGLLGSRVMFNASIPKLGMFEEKPAFKF